MKNCIKCHLFMKKRLIASRTFQQFYLAILILNTLAIALADYNVIQLQQQQQQQQHQQQQQQQQQQYNRNAAEARKLFGGYRITPKHCRVNKLLTHNDNDTRSVAICMFNHECAQRGGKVVGACMDGFLFGACCQVSNAIDVEHTLINDAQNSNYHYQYQQKWQEPNYELLNSENSTRAENNNYVESNANDAETDKFTNIATHTQNDMASVYPALNKIQIPEDSVKITPSSGPILQQDDLVMQAFNTHTLSTYIGPSHIPTHTTELSMRIDINANSNSNSIYKDKETNKVKVKPSLQLNSNAIQSTTPNKPSKSTQSTRTTRKPIKLTKPTKPTKPTKLTRPYTQSNILLVNNSNLEISHNFNESPVKANATKINLNANNQQNQFILVHTLTNNNAEGNEPIKNVATTASAITTHANAIETIIQQLNNSNQPGPAYSIVEHQTVPVVSNYNHIGNEKINSTKHSENDSLLVDFSPENFQEEQTVPSTNYDDHITFHNHQTSEFNKMPSLGIAYPVDVTYIDEDDPILITNTIKQKPSQFQHRPSANIYDQGNKEEQEQYQQLFEKPIQPIDKNKDNVTALGKEKPTKIMEYPMNNVNYSNEKPKPLEHYGDGNSGPDSSILQIAQQSIKPEVLESNANVTIIQSTSQKIPYEEDMPVTIIKGTTNEGSFIHNISKPLDNYSVLVTSQNYNPSPILPNEVLVSSSTTLVQEPLRGQNELYTTMISLPNKLVSTIKPFSSSTISTTTTTTTTAIKPPSKLITQYYENNKPLVVTTQITEKLDSSSTLLLYGQHTYSSTHHTFYPSQPTNHASSNYGTTSRPPASINYHYNDVPPLIITNDKLDSLTLATGDQIQSSSEPSPSNQQQAYGESIYLNSVAPLKVQIPSKPEQVVNTIKTPVTVSPQSPTVHITPKPTKQQIILSSTPAYQQINSLASNYNTLVTKLPSSSDVSGMVSINPNDFYDPGYYASNDQIKTTTEFAVPSDDRPAFPGYYGPTPIYPTFPVPNEKDDTVIEEETYTSPNDFVNFPPVRNPNLNMTVTLSPVTTDFQLSTPAFVEDGILKNKMKTLVSKIVESLQGNFEALAEIIDDTKGARPSISSHQTAAPSNIVNEKPTRKPSAKPTTTRPRTTTKKPATRITTKAPTKRTTTRRPTTTTKRVVNKRTTTTTQKPVSKKPIKKTTTTTTRVPIEADEYNVNGEDEGEYINPSANEIDAAQTQTGGASRKFQCGVRPQLKSGRIVGGKGSTFGAYPWQVLVRESTWLGLFTKNKCGGVLITSRFVITAAHCQPGFLASLVAVMGEFDISGDSESKRSVTKNVKRVIVHRHYDPATFENDIALLELDTPVQFDTHIIPICMPSDKADFTGRMATVTGWGRLKYGGGVPSILQEVQVPIIENSVCQEMFNTAGHNKRIINSFLCAGYANGQKDSCEGDSGGPLVLKRSDGRYELAGTVSHGIKCAAPYLPGVYMRTTFYKPWLRTITGVK